MARNNPHGLTDKQLRFANNYITSYDLNATRAYKAAYPDCKSDPAARSSASRLLTNPNIKKYFNVLGMQLFEGNQQQHWGRGRPW